MHGRRHSAIVARPANSFGDAAPAAGRSWGGAQRAVAGDLEEIVEKLLVCPQPAPGKPLNDYVNAVCDDSAEETIHAIQR